MNTIGFDKCCCIPWHCIEWKFMCGMWMNVLQCVWGHLNTAVTQCARTWVSTLVFAKFFVLFFCVHRCGRWLLLLMMIVNIIISHSAERRHAQQPQIKRFITWRSHTRSNRHRHNHFSCRFVHLYQSLSLSQRPFFYQFTFIATIYNSMCATGLCALRTVSPLAFANAHIKKNNCNLHSIFKPAAATTRKNKTDN